MRRHTSAGSTEQLITICGPETRRNIAKRFIKTTACVDMHTYTQGLKGLDSAAECTGPIASIRDTTTHTYTHKQMHQQAMINITKRTTNKQVANTRLLTCKCLSRDASQIVLYAACHQDEESHCEELINERYCQNSPCAELSTNATKQSGQRAPATTRLDKCREL